MANYFIYEGNLEKLEKKIHTIERKCNKYGLVFKYEKLGHEFRDIELPDGDKITAKYIEISVEGIMKHQDWEFIAKVDHYVNGNIIRQFKTDIDVPLKYRHTDPICEHCKTSRRRKFTYLVHNTTTDEWKQVGASCLKEFTCGLDVEDVAKYISLFDYIIEGEEGCYTGISYERYYNLKEILCYAKEVVDHLGYVSSSDAEYYGKDSTKGMTLNFYFGVACKNKFFEHWREEAQNIGIDANRESTRKYVDDAISWIKSVEVNLEDSYMFNLKIACNEDYSSARNIGFVVSLIPTYYRHLKNLEYEEKKRQARENESVSEYQGEIGQRLTVKVISVECVWSNDSYYGWTYLYKFIDENGNIYMWSTGKNLADVGVTKLTGTVKSHDEYNGVKQTHLTRCKVA